MEQQQRHVAGARHKRQIAAVGDNGSALAAVAEVVDDDVVQAVAGLVDAGGAQKEAARHDVVDNLLTQRKRRLGTGDVGLQNAQPMIRGRQDVVVEVHHANGKHGRTAKYRREDA